MTSGIFEALVGALPVERNQIGCVACVGVGRVREFSREESQRTPRGRGMARP